MIDDAELELLAKHDQQLVSQERFPEVQELFARYRADAAHPHVAEAITRVLESALQMLKAQKAHYLQELIRLQVQSSYGYAPDHSSGALDTIA